MKNNKTLRIILDLLLIIVGIGFLISGIKDAYNFYNESKNKNVIEDSERFRRSFRSAPVDNIYKYVDLDEANDILLNKTGVILLGKTNDPWLQVLVEPLNNIVKEELDTIYYLELDDIDASNFQTSDYDKPVIQTRLEDIVLPYIYIVKDGVILEELGKEKIIDKNYDEAPIEYFSDKRVAELKEKLNKISELK